MNDIESKLSSNRSLSGPPVTVFCTIYTTCISVFPHKQLFYQFFNVKWTSILFVHENYTITPCSFEKKTSIYFAVELSLREIS